MMRDPITDAAQDPSCLLCLTPDRGGSWWSRLRPAMPRNFAANPMTFTDSYTAQDGIGTDDFTLSVDFTLLEESVHGTINIGCMQCIYYDSTKGHQPSVRILKSDGTKSALYPVGTSHIWGNVASIKVIKTGQNVRMVVHARDGSTIKEGTVAIPDGATVTSSSGATTYPGNIFAASIRNDTTGTAVWQAAYSDLYDTSNPWPSPVPRNFAEEPMTWRDEKTTAPLIGEDDCEFFIRYRLDGYPEGSAISQIFYHNSQNGSINIAFAGDGTGGNYSVIRLTDVDGVVIPLDRVRQLGEHTIRVRRVGLTVTVEFDGEVVATSSAGTKKIAVYSTTAPVSDFDGVVFETHWKSLTTGRTVWRYPSDAERVRLITKTNVRTDRGAFEAADETKPARVDTALDLRGKISDYTLFVEFDAAALENESVNYCKQELAGQGASKGSIPSPLAVNYNKQLNVDTFEYRLEVSVDIAGARHLSEAILPGHLVGRNSVVAVVELMDDKTRLSIYHCGVLLKSEIVDGIPKMDGYTCPDSFALMDNRNGLWSNYYGKIHSCLLFDRALSAAEIAALTPKRQPLSWAGIRDVVRRGRAQRYFAVGDVLTVATPRWTIEYEVTGFDQVEPADAALTHSMTLLPVRLVTNLQFDAPEPGNPDANRAQYGCNRWDWSSIRQWLNSAAAPGEWWTVQHEYDAAPAYAATLAGFMADLPADFLNAVAPTRLVTALSNAYGGGSVETVDRFWLPSRTEIFGDANNGVAEGVQMAKYIDATDADRIKYNSAGTASGWALRSSNRSNSYNIVNVSANGIMQELSWSSAWSGGIVPACIIA